MVHGPLQLGHIDYAGRAVRESMAQRSGLTAARARRIPANRRFQVSSLFHTGGARLRPVLGEARGETPRLRHSPRRQRDGGLLAARANWRGAGVLGPRRFRQPLFGDAKNRSRVPWPMAAVTFSTPALLVLLIISGLPQAPQSILWHEDGTSG
jgi:hypothetical protein